MPWQPKPGYVRVSRARLVELQSKALWALELEAVVAGRETECARLEAEVAARRVLAAIDARPALVDVSDELPFRSDGSLHEEALRAVCDTRLWADRERQLAAYIDRGEA